MKTKRQRAMDLERNLFSTNELERMSTAELEERAENANKYSLDQDAMNELDRRRENARRKGRIKKSIW